MPRGGVVEAAREHHGAVEDVADAVDLDPAARRSGVALDDLQQFVDRGAEAVVFLVAAILAFPATWRQRAVGLAAAIGLIQILNLARVVTLFLINRYKPDLFELFHLAIWQTVIGGAAIALFYVWTTRVHVAQRA